MKQDNVVVGGLYEAKVSDRLVPVRVEAFIDRPSSFTTRRTKIRVVNQATGRTLLVSAARLRRALRDEQATIREAQEHRAAHPPDNPFAGIFPDPPARIEVELLAFGNGEIREVEVPAAEWREAVRADSQPGADPIPYAKLGQVFRYGQNDFQPRPHPSVSVGDVIRLGKRYTVKPFGFEEVK